MQSSTTARGESARAPTDPAAFEYVETAFGGVDRRNGIRKLADVRLNGVADCYASHNRGTDALATWVATHENEKGNPTVAGFDGETWAPDLHLDFDAEGNPGKALDWLRGVLDRLESWGVDLSAVRIYFSGYKGFHLELPHSLFGGFAPSKEFPKRLRRAAKHILGTIPFDTSVYDTLRLWRIENSKNAKSGLYKIRLTVAEARTLDIDAIRELATAPREAANVPDFAPIPDDEWMPVDELVAIWADTVAPDERAQTRLTGLMVEPVRVPESLHCDELLAELRGHGLQLAVVVDEYGGTAGVVTVEDLVEELVGTVRDEHDRIEEPEVIELSNTCWSVSGLVRRDELSEQLDFSPPEGPYDTLAGLVMYQHGQVPAGDETVTVDDWTLTVTRMDGRRIDRVRVCRPDGDGT